MKTSLKNSTNSIPYISGAVVALVALTVLAPTSQAAEPSESATKSVVVLQKTISYADLDIDSSRGARLLLSRLQTAAKAVCSPEPGVLDLKGQQDWRNCYDRAISQ